MSACANSPGTAGAQAQALVSATRSTSEQRALVGDDAETARLIPQGLLERERVEAMIAENGDEAVERIRRNPLGFGLIEIAMACQEEVHDAVSIDLLVGLDRENVQVQALQDSHWCR